jgi:hypothetical protein
MRFFHGLDGVSLTRKIGLACWLSCRLDLGSFGLIGGSFKELDKGI